MSATKPAKRKPSSGSVEFITHGCRLNAFETEVMRKHLADQRPGDQATGASKSKVIINTCAVTAESERQARQAVRRARRENPHAEIVVTGCAAQINPQQFSQMTEVDRVVGNQEKMLAQTWSSRHNDPSSLLVSDIMQVKETADHLVDGFVEHTRAFVQVQQGCDHRCTFCIIPFGRGNSRSVPAGQVVQQIQKLVISGVKEVVLTGVDISSWGGDLPGQPPLGNLVRRILKLVPDLPRLRISSIDSVEIDQDLIQALADEPRLMPHLHLSLQAGSDMILKRMKRRHLRQDAISLCQDLRAARSDLVLGADFITGFPTETDAMFEQTLDLVKECDLTYLHVFPYSERPGTPAAAMPPVDKAVRKARAAQLRNLGEKRKHAFFAQHFGSRQTLLMESNNRGRTKHFVPVQLSQDQDIPAGQLIEAQLSDFVDHIGHIKGRALTSEA